MSEAVRLDRLLSERGNMTRKEAKEVLRQGGVLVDGAVEKHPDRKIVPGENQITVNGTGMNLDPGKRWFMLNKPLGVITATEDRQQKTVMELLAGEGKGLFPVGRLDKDTEGLLLITDDGEQAHRLTSPRRHVSKIYLAETQGDVTPEDVAAFAAGIALKDGTVCRPALLEPMGESLCRVTVEEGKYHQVRRMLASCGKPVTALKRVKFGPLELDVKLKPGEYRPLTEREMALLREETK